MKNIIIFSFLLFTGNSLSGQADTALEVMPQFTGGAEKMYQFIFENIQYPVQARMNGISGTVYAKFIVDTTGSLMNIHIVRGLAGGCNDEVLRVIELMNANRLWLPATVDGRPVPVEFTLPITFALGGKAKKSKADN